MIVGTAAVAIAGAAAFALPANAASTGKNGAVYGTLSGTNCDWNLSAHSIKAFYGHLEVTVSVRTGIETSRTTHLYNSPTGANPHFANLIRCTGQDSWVCVTGWRLNSNRTYTNVGKPCFTAYHP
jgi:hypothetical protein